MMIAYRNRKELAARPISEAITARGKELSVDDTVAAARRLFVNDSVHVLPVLDGTTYVGAVDRDAIEDVPDTAAIGSFASALLPTATAATTTEEALAALDRDGSGRLVVLDSDHTGYVGLVCLRGDRERLCVDVECHIDTAALSSKGHPR